MTTYNIRTERWIHGAGKQRHFDVCHNPTSSALYSTAEDGSLKFWDFEKRRVVASVKAHSDEALRVALLDGADAVITGGADGFAKVWSLAATPDDAEAFGTEQLKLDVGGQVYAVGSLTRSLAYAAAENQVSFFDLHSGACEKTLQFPKLGDLRHGGPRNENDLAYVFDAQPCNLSTGELREGEADAMIVACSDGSVRVLSAPDGHEIQSLAGVGCGAHVTATLAIDCYILICGGAGSIEVIDMRTWRRVSWLPEAHMGPVYGTTRCEMAFDGSVEGNESLLASWSGDGSVKFWRLAAFLANSGEDTGEDALVVQTREDRTYPIYNATWNSERSVLACAGGGDAFLANPLVLHRLENGEVSKE